MGIQQRLLKQRYSAMNLRTPTKEELNECGLTNVRFRSVSPISLSKIRAILLTPNKKDSHYETYLPLIKDFYAEVDKVKTSGRRPRVESEIYNQQLVRKLAYYIRYPQYFAHSFEHYAITWMFNLQMSMRSYIMRQRIARGELPPIWNKSIPATNGYYKLPKPMGNPSMYSIAGDIYDIVYSDVIRYLSKV
jgi:hypothetical protein